MRGALAGLTLSLVAAFGWGLAAAAAWDPPRGSAGDIRQHADEFAWRLFIALSWPADSKTRGVPDGERPLGAAGPVVWESWLTARQVYREDGADPGPWTAAGWRLELPSEQRFETLSLKDFPHARQVVNGRMVDVADPIQGARRLTEIRLNRATYQFIRAHQFYNLEGQLHAVVASEAISFPYGATEVKAKWRPITEAERSRYHSLRVRQADGSTRLYGLTALAIASKLLPNWLWATFEHVDNPTLPNHEGWQLPSHDRFACGNEPPDCNRVPSGLGLEGTVWQFYRLRGTQTDFLNPAGEPNRLANSELESGFQTTASCMTCHARASVAAQAAVTALRLPIFDTGPTVAAADPLARRGFVGAPRREWFAPAAADATSYVPLDFVWSMSQAQPRAAGGVPP